MNTIFLTHEQILNHWDFLSREIRIALDTGDGESTEIDICKKALNNQAQIWVVQDEEGIKNVTVTEIIQYATFKTLHIITTTGDGFDEYSEQHKVLEEYAKEINAKHIEFWGRKGWLRKLKPMGYKESYTVMRKEID